MRIRFENRRIGFRMDCRIGWDWKGGFESSEHSSCDELGEFLERMDYKEIEFIV